MNKITHFIDGSSVYGSDPKQTGELRSFERGKLKVFRDFERDLLPLSKDSDACVSMESSACFTSGQLRINSQKFRNITFWRQNNQKNRKS